MSNYNTLDSALLQLIAAGVNTFHEIESHKAVRKITATLKAESFKPRTGYTDEFRFVDRRLQALRKAGRISFQSGAWVIV